MKIYVGGIGTVVEGELEELLAAGILLAGDRIPRRSPGYVERYDGYERGQWFRISRLRNGQIRVRGRFLEAARADQAFRRFLAAAARADQAFRRFLAAAAGA